MAQAIAPEALELPPRLVLFDGVCGFCDDAVQWLLAHDPAGRLHFAPLQGETAAGLRRLHPEIPEDLDTMVLIASEGGRSRVYLRSQAIFRTCAELAGAWRLLAGLRFLPRALADVGYRFFARNRYRWFGRLDACRIPDAAVRRRFLP
jgi:predicted DCC family thiol-disulfide oxidoreductase YuxK